MCYPKKKKAILFIIVSKNNNKILRNNKCNNKEKDLHIENYKMLMKETEEGTNKWGRHSNVLL